MTSTPAVLALGANLGDPMAALKGAIEALGQHPEIEIKSVSSIYQTDPVGGPEQPVYLNAVLLAQTTMTAHELLGVAHEIENSSHRTREVRWGPRTLDIDLITFGELIVTDEVLTVPHPRAQDREFVLVPWLEINPAAVLPGIGPIAGLAAARPTGAVRLTSALPFIELNP
ncbi:MAG: 2-amino-4-hydroxy-6-hydroxymethyldihydropteridine diphosphokinase [Candidatus Nanopelagicales bacterium]|nr:2-amino-4-hydroxy-6-hydroxymethyldihydropteridine diphosphokinase [Candidatus Nanopelagicales bacterium]